MARATQGGEGKLCDLLQDWSEKQLARVRPGTGGSRDRYTRGM